MRKAKKYLSATIVALFLAGIASAQEPDPQVTLFTNVNVFDGVHEKLIKNANVVVTGNKISAVSTEPLAVAGGRVIDGGGRTLMPGLIDAHWHTMFNFSPVSNTLGSSFGYLSVAAELLTNDRDGGEHPILHDPRFSAGRVPATSSGY